MYFAYLFTNVVYVDQCRIC